MGADSGTEEARPYGKGKEKESAPDETTAASTQNGPSLASRVANSAASLSRSLLSGRPDVSDLSRAIPSNKPESSSSQARASWTGETASHQENTLRSSSTGSSGHLNEHIKREETAFAEFLDSTSVLLPHEADVREQAWGNTGHLNGEHRPQFERSRGSSSVAEQQRRDGSDVVALLSRNYEDDPTDDEGPELSTEEAAKLRNALFGGKSTYRSDSSSWDYVLNFIPEPLRYPAGRTRQDGTQAQDLEASLGVSTLSQAWNIWVGQWSDVLTRYTDEVWGDLSSLVREAREEVKQLEQSGASVDGPQSQTKALQRLRNILGHLREY